MSFRMVRHLLALVLVLLVTTSLLQVWAQTTTTGDISGVVTDQTGALVPNAALTLKSLSTGSTASATSNAQGAYRFALVAPGSYSVTARAQGFQAVSKSVSVALGSDTAANIQLSISSSQETIEVTGATTSVET